MLQKFMKDSFTYSITNTLTSVISLALLPLYTRIFSPSDYGIIDILNIVTALLNTIISLEISQAVGRHMGDERNIHKRSVYFSTALIFTLIIYSLSVILAITNSEYLSQLILGKGDMSKIIIITFLSIWTNGLFNLTRGQLRWLSRPLKYSVVSLLYSLVTISITFFLVFVKRVGVIGIFYGLLIGGFTCFVLALYYVKDSFILAFDRKRLVEMLKFSIPLVPSSISVLVFMYIDRITIKQMMTFNDIGLYSVGYKIASVMSLFIMGVQMALTPIIYNHYNEKNIPLELARLSHYFILLVFAISLSTCLFAKEIMVIFTTSSYYKAAEVVPFLVFSILFSGVYVFVPGLWIKKKTKIIAFINIGTAILNIILNYLLIPIWGIKGSAVATMVSAFASFYINQTLSQRYYPIPYPWKKIVCSLFIVILAISLDGIFLAYSCYTNVALKIFIISSYIFISSYILIDKSEYIIVKNTINNLKLKM